MFAGSGAFDMSRQQAQPQQAAWPAQQAHVAPAGDAGQGEGDEGDSSRRPPNGFILYSQAMRSSVRQDNPSLSNTEVSRLLGKMWKEVPNDVKLQYKQKAAVLQEDFKRQHPDYTYRKARRKRALNELLTKSTQGYGQMPPGGFPQQDMTQQWQGMMQTNPMFYQQFQQFGMPQQQGFSMPQQQAQGQQQMPFQLGGAFPSNQQAGGQQSQQSAQSLFPMGQFPQK